MDTFYIILVMTFAGAGACGGLVSYYLHRWHLSRALKNALLEVNDTVENAWLEKLKQESSEWDISIKTPKTTKTTPKKTRPSTTVTVKGSPVTREQAKEYAKRAK